MTDARRAQLARVQQLAKDALKAKREREDLVALHAPHGFIEATSNLNQYEVALVRFLIEAVSAGSDGEFEEMLAEAAEGNFDKLPS